MTDTIREPWICSYLVETGEQYGGSLLSVPFREKKKKVQLIELLTFPRDPDDACNIWGIVSDKSHKIPVRFTTDASNAFNKKYPGRSLPSFLNGILVIKTFRPTLTKVPLPNNVRKMTTQSFITLVVENVDVLGSQGEAQFGKPRDVEEEENVKAWVEGLRVPGGAGNVLKLRKEEADRDTVRPAPAKLPQQIPLRIPQHPEQSLHQNTRESDTTVARTISPKRKDSLLKEYYKAWRCVKPLKRYVHMPRKIQQVEDDAPVESTSAAVNDPPPNLAQGPHVIRRIPSRHALDLGSSQPRPATPEYNPNPAPKQTSPTISEWPPSPARDIQVDPPVPSPHPPPSDNPSPYHLPRSIVGANGDEKLQGIKRRHSHVSDSPARDIQVDLPVPSPHPPPSDNPSPYHRPKSIVSASEDEKLQGIKRRHSHISDDASPRRPSDSCEDPSSRMKKKLRQSSEMVEEESVALVGTLPPGSHNSSEMEVVPTGAKQTGRKLMGFTVNLYHNPYDVGDGYPRMRWAEWDKLILDVGRVRTSKEHRR